MMNYVKVAKTSQITPGNKLKIVHENNEILLVNIQGTYYALNNKCPHMGGSLYDGTLEGNSVVCPRHHSRFDLTTGESIEGPKIMFLRFKVGNAETYPVKVEGYDIFIGI